MKKALLLSATFALLATTAVMAQKPVYTEGNKIDARLEHALKTGTTTTLAANGQYATRRISTDGRLSVIINAEDAQVVADLLEADGHEAVTVGDNIVTAKLTSQEIKQLAARSDVYTISLPRQLRPHLKAARDSIGATSVQNGVELETPYDGTGVLVGVIDQGFYPRHLAFYDAKWENAHQAVVEPHQQSVDETLYRAPPERRRRIGGRRTRHARGKHSGGTQRRQRLARYSTQRVALLYRLQFHDRRTHV